MSEKTKIVVIHMKELLYTAIFTVLIIILVIVLICMFLPKADKNPDAISSSMPSETPVVTEDILSLD